MSERKRFKPGDKVVCISNWERKDKFWLPVGSIHTVHYDDGRALELVGIKSNFNTHLRYVPGRFVLHISSLSTAMAHFLLNGEEDVVIRTVNNDATV